MAVNRRDLKDRPQNLASPEGSKLEGNDNPAEGSELQSPKSSIQVLQPSQSDDEYRNQVSQSNPGGKPSEGNADVAVDSSLADASNTVPLGPVKQRPNKKKRSVTQAKSNDNAPKVGPAGASKGKAVRKRELENLPPVDAPVGKRIRTTTKAGLQFTAGLLRPPWDRRSGWDYV